jgi:hypothetical protein
VGAVRGLGPETPPPDTAARLLAWDVPVVGAPVVARVPPYFLYAGHFRGTDGAWDPLTLGPDTPALAPVDFCGIGCTLIRRPVLATIDPYPFTPGDNADSEDKRFFLLVRQAGIPVYPDTTLRVGHLVVQSLVAPEQPPPPTPS